MKKYIACLFIILSGCSSTSFAQSDSSQTPDLKIVFIRHGEKPEKGSNLTCKGLNRSLMLPGLIKKKFGVPDFVYVPSLKVGEKTTHARMFETVAPLAEQYNLDINSKFDEDDSTGIAHNIMQKKGTVLVIWEHRAISTIIHALGVQYNTVWANGDYDSIIIITFTNGKAVISTDKEGLNPSENCPN